MARLAFLLAAALLAAPFTAAAEDVLYARSSDGDCVEAVAASSVDQVQYFPAGYTLQGDVMSTEDDAVTVETAVGFSVTYYKNYKVVNNTLAGEVYVLYQCGTTLPDTLPQGAKVFQVPLASVSVPDTTPFAFINALGVADRVHSVSPYTTAPCGQQLVACNRTADGMMDLSNSTLVGETFAGVADAVVSTMSVAGPMGVAFNAVSDPGALHRAEWIKYLALFFNREALANALYNETSEAYVMHQEMAASAPDAPTVAWITHFVYGEEESYQISFDEYKMQLVEDAGGSTLNREDVLSIPGVAPASYSETDLAFSWADNTTFASKEEALAAFHDMLANVDVVIDETYSFDPATYTMDSFLAEYELDDEEFTFLANASVFRLDGLLSAAGGMDWFEGAVVAADKVLRDVLRAVHPTLVKNPGSYNWIRNIAAGEVPKVVSAAACDAISTCAITPKPICPYVSLCPDGSAATLLDGADSAACQYEPCKA